MPIAEMPERKERFQVDSLTEVSKLEASQAIEQLLAESKGGGEA